MSDKSKRPEKVKAAPVVLSDAQENVSKPKNIKAASKSDSTALPAKVPKIEKPKKEKMVRDSYTMPESDYANFASLKARCLAVGVNTKKSEILRAALTSLSKLTDKALIKAIADLNTIKTGRPAKNA